MTTFARPTDLPSALALMSDGARQVLGGGTDIYPGAGAKLDQPLLDITALPELKGIHLASGLRIGAAATWSQIAETPLPPALAGLQQAARQVGARQIQNSGTIAGNLCNASPAADGVPPLLTLDASVELASSRGTRHLPLAAFISGARRTARAADELMVAIHIPARALQGEGAFVKLGARAYLVISIAMVATRIVSQNGIVTDCAIAVGACSAVATRLPRVESALIGQPLDDLARHVIGADVNAALTPISDIRAPADYRAEAAVTLLRGVLGGIA